MGGETATAPRYIAGVDLGGTKIISMIATTDGEVLAKDRRLTKADEGPNAVIARIIDSLSEVSRTASVPLAAVQSVGLAVPGPVNQASGDVSDPPNLPGWHNVPIGILIRDALHVPVLVENDGNAAAIGEHRFGAGRGSRYMLYLTVSTGIGGGIIIDNRLYRGASGAAGELGHIVILADGPACGCGGQGCLEALASGTAIAREGARLAVEDRSGILAKLVRTGEVTAELVADATDRGDAEAARTIDQAARYLGLGLASFVNLFNPEVIVIGGGATKIGARLLGPAESTMRSVAFPQPAADVSVRLSELEDDAVVLGAIALTRESLLRDTT